MTVQKLGIDDVRRNVKYGGLAGHIAAWSIFGLIFFVDVMMRLETGTFYNVIGLTVGAGLPAAVYVGFVLHILTGTVIGLLFGYITTVIRPFNISSVPKVLGLAMLTGFVSWIVLFVPITVFAVQPALPNIAATLGQPLLLEASSKILAGAIAMHVIYGGVLALMYYLATVPSPRDYES